MQQYNSNIKVPKTIVLTNSIGKLKESIGKIVQTKKTKKRNKSMDKKGIINK